MISRPSRSSSLGSLMPSSRLASPLAAMLVVSLLGCGGDGGEGPLPEPRPLSILAG